jgi:hypothetical protein
LPHTVASAYILLYEESYNSMYSVL